MEDGWMKFMPGELRSEHSYTSWVCLHSSMEDFKVETNKQSVSKVKRGKLLENKGLISQLHTEFLIQSLQSRCKEGEASNHSKHRRVLDMASSSLSGPSKRQRGAANGSQQVQCLVDGCNSDLSNCKDYHRRHKVCELHAKTPQVIIRGLNQRFCQQCSRFHSLEEFDEGKRSCRKRLDDHNRRRRKPQPEPLRQEQHPSTLCSFQGSALLPFQGEFSINAEADSKLLGQYHRLNFFHKQYAVDESSTSIGRGREGRESVNPSPLLRPPMAFPVIGDCALSLLSSPTTLPSPSNSSRSGQPALQHPLRYMSLQPIPMDSNQPPTFKNDEFNSPSFPSLWDQ